VLAYSGRLVALWQWSLIVAIWAVVMAALFSLGDGGPIPGTSAAAGIVLLVANARTFKRGERSPLVEGNSGPAESLLGLALLALAVCGAMGWTLWFFACVAAAGTAAGDLVWHRVQGAGD
jgi:hypothetical protein